MAIFSRVTDFLLIGWHMGGADISFTTLSKSNPLNNHHYFLDATARGKRKEVEDAGEATGCSLDTSDFSSMVQIPLFKQSRFLKN